jgi:glycosyltransferase involved in cell wall biosynthesis
VRILVWHGYLLAGTGSNVYTRALVREWSRAGHEVVVFSQEPHPEAYDLGGAEPVRPEIGGVLPVFVVDRYEGLEARRLQELTREERERYVTANAAAVRERLPADLVFANHVLPGGAVAYEVGGRYAVKVHGSELEYAMRGNEELAAWGKEALADAEAVFVGSAHIREALEEVVGHVDRVHEVPPGVDVDEFRPRPREEALAGLLEEARRDPPNHGNARERLPDEGNTARLEAFLAGDEPTVVYFGKLLYNKGVHVLLEALRGLDARAVVVGFGDYRRELEAAAPERTLFTGPFEHRHLVHLLPLADVAVVPSIFPEAFGMVAAEAAAAGCPALVARHSGLAEVARGLEAEYPERHAALASFANGDVDDLRAKLRALLALPAEERRELGAAARRAAVSRWSWASVATRLLAPFLTLVLVATGCSGKSSQATRDARHVSAMWRFELRKRAQEAPRQRFDNLSPQVLRRRLDAAARRYDFEVVSFRLLRPRQLAPRIVVRTRHDVELVHAVPRILRRLDPKAGTGDDRTGWRYEGFWFEADDEHGDPLLAVFNFWRGPHAGGGQWARSDELFPFAHG